MAGGKAEQFKYNIEIRKHHLTICNYSGVLTSQSSQCHQISCFSSWMSYLATNFQSGHIIIRLNIQGSCQIPNSTWSQNRPRIVLPLTLNLFLFFLSALFTKASFRILGHWNYICSQMLFKVDTDSWQVGFYGLTLGFALLFNMSDSVFQVWPHEIHVKLYLSLNQGAFSSVIGRFPSTYMGGMMQVIQSVSMEWYRDMDNQVHDTVSCFLMMPPLTNNFTNQGPSIWRSSVFWLLSVIAGDRAGPGVNICPNCRFLAGLNNTGLWQIFTHALDQTNVALVYFLIASIYLLLSLFLYLWISRHPFYKQYAAQDETSEKGETSSRKANIKEVSLQVWLPALTVLLVYLVTLGEQHWVKANCFITFDSLFRHLSISTCSGPD